MDVPVLSRTRVGRMLSDLGFDWGAESLDESDRRYRRLVCAWRRQLDKARDLRFYVRMVESG